MNEELKSMIRQSAEEEQHDIDKYKRMADMAEEAGDNKIAGVLRDIAGEESSHKMLLKQILGEYAP